MIYSQIPPTYKYDVLAEAIYAGEMEHFHYSLDAVNFAYLIANQPESEYKRELQTRLVTTQEQMAKVEGVYGALVAQIEDQAEYAAAVQRAVQKRSASA
jgi:hypothetical protein